MENSKITVDVPTPAWVIVDGSGKENLCIISPAGMPENMILLFASNEATMDFIAKSEGMSASGLHPFLLKSLGDIYDAIKIAKSIGAKYVGIDFRINFVVGGRWFECDAVLQKIAAMLN